MRMIFITLSNKSLPIELRSIGKMINLNNLNNFKFNISLKFRG